MVVGFDSYHRKKSSDFFHKTARFAEMQSIKIDLKFFQTATTIFCFPIDTFLRNVQLTAHKTNFAIPFFPPFSKKFSQFYLLPFPPFRLKV